MSERPHVLCGGCFASQFPRARPAVDIGHPIRPCCRCNRPTHSGILISDGQWACGGDHEDSSPAITELFSPARYWKELTHWTHAHRKRP